MAKRKSVLVRWLKKVRATQKKRHAAALRQAKANAKRVERHQAEIRKQSRTTAGALRESGEWDWAGDGMENSTVVEPVQNDRGGWEWVPVSGTGRGVTRAKKTTVGELRRGGNVVISPWVPDSQQCEVRAGGAIVIAAGTPLAALSVCGAPTKDGTPCERVGNCPIAAHRRHKSK